MSDEKPVQREPFAKQAAKFCLYAPLVVIAMNIFLGSTVTNVEIAKHTISGISVLLILSSLVFGVIALFGMRKHGRSGILFRALAGMLISGIAIVAFVSLVYVLLNKRAALSDDFVARATLIGVWEGKEDTPQGPVVYWIRLRSDGTYEYRIAGNLVADFSGTWVVRDSMLGIHVEKMVSGNKTLLGKMVTWKISNLSPETLALMMEDELVVFRKLNISIDHPLQALEADYLKQNATDPQFPAWIGEKVFEGAQIIIMSLDDRSEDFKVMTSNVTDSVSICLFRINNSAGGKNISFLPESVVFYNGDEIVAETIPRKDIFSGALIKDEDLLKTATLAITTAPGMANTEALYIPKHTNMSTVTHVECELNGTRFIVTGEFFSTERLQEILKAHSPSQDGQK